MLKFVLCLGLLVPVVFISQSAIAAPVTCSPMAFPPSLPGCVPVPGSQNAWAVRATGTPAAGRENEPLGEDLMALSFGLGSTFTAPNLSFLVLSENGLFSDWIFFAVSPNEVVVEFLDLQDSPNPPPLTVPSMVIGT